MRSTPRLAFLLGLLLLSLMAHGIPANNALQYVKQTTALVIDAEGDSGTAFCIDKSGLFLTNAHVVGRNKTMKLVLNAGEATQTVYKAQVLKTLENDAIETGVNMDFALLKITPGKALPFLELGDSDALTETTPLMVLGYPFGEGLATDEDLKYPTISVNTCKVTSLRKAKGQLVVVQIDGGLNPGNSGGPLLNAEGKVVGIAWAGVQGAGLCFAIPSNMARIFLNEPAVSVTVSSIPLKEATRAMDLPVIVANPMAPETQFSVDVILDQGKPNQRTISATRGQDGAYHASFAPISLRSLAFPSIPLTVVVKRAVTEVSIPDQAVTVGTNNFKLSTIASMSLGANPSVTLVTGDTFAGAITGLGTATVDVNGTQTPIDLSQAETILVASPLAAMTEIPFVVQVRNQQAKIAEVKGAVPIIMPPQPSRAGIIGSILIPPDLPLGADELRQQPKYMRLPSAVDDAVVGGAGRFLFLVARQDQKITVFDMFACTADRTIPMPASNALIAANVDTLYIVLPDQKICQRYSLLTWNKLSTTRLPFDGIPMNIACGWNSDAPVLIRWADATDALANCHFEFFDPRSLARIATNRVFIDGGNCYRDHGHLRASGEGTLFGLWTTEQAPTGLEGIRLTGNVVSVKYDHTSVGFIAPSADGNYLVAQSGVFNADCTAVGKKNENMQNARANIPALGPAYYLQMDATVMPMVLRVCVFGNDTPLVTLNGFIEFNIGLPRDTQDFTLEKHFIFNPQAKLLVTIASGGLALRRLDIGEALERSGQNYLFIVSSPVATARKGGTYRYPVQSLAHKGGLKYSIDGPPGMTISPEGVITWTVPQTTTDKQVPVIVTVTDAFGKNIFQSFNITLQ